MTEHTAVRTDNRFSQIPHWVTESPISDGAYRLYGVLMKYAHYQTRDAYPSRATLARDVRKSDRSVDGYIKELCAIGALKVLRRKRKGTKENYTNLYHVITANPHADDELSADAPEADWEVVEEVAKSASLGGEERFAENDTYSTTPSSSSLRSHHPAGDADSSLPLASPDGDAATLKAAALAMYLDGCEDPDAFIDLYETIHPGASIDVGHLIINCWGPEGTTARIDRLIAKAAGKRDPVTYGVGKWVRTLPGITHGALGG